MSETRKAAGYEERRQGLWDHSARSVTRLSSAERPNWVVKGQRSACKAGENTSSSKTKKMVDTLALVSFRICYSDAVVGKTQSYPLARLHAGGNLLSIRHPSLTDHLPLTVNNLYNETPLSFPINQHESLRCGKLVYHLGRLTCRKLCCMRARTSASLRLCDSVWHLDRLKSMNMYRRRSRALTVGGPSSAAVRRPAGDLHNGDEGAIVMGGRWRDRPVPPLSRPLGSR